MAEVIMAPNNSDKARDARTEAAKYRAPQNAASNSSGEQSENVSHKSGTIKVKRKKKNVVQKIFAQFVEEDAESIKDYIIDDVVIPKVKDLIYDGISGAVGRSLYGGGPKPTSNVKRYGTSSYPSTPYTSYSSRYSHGSSTNSFIAPREPRRLRKIIIDDLIFDTRDEAETVLKKLLEIYFEYGNASISDLYECAELDDDVAYTDDSYGWMKDVNGLESAYIDHVRDGWKLYLPPVKPLV